MSVEASVTDTRPDSVIMLLTGGVIGPLTGMVIGESTRGMTGIRVETLAGVFMTVVVVVVNVLEGVSPALCGTDVSAGTVFDTDTSIIVRVDVVVNVLIVAMARTCKVVAANIGVTTDSDANIWLAVMFALEYAASRASFEESLLFLWTGFACSPIAAILCCRALQAWMPWYHVC